MKRVFSVLLLFVTMQAYSQEWLVRDTEPSDLLFIGDDDAIRSTPVPAWVPLIGNDYDLYCKYLLLAYERDETNWSIESIESIENFYKENGNTYRNGHFYWFCQEEEWIVVDLETLVYNDNKYYMSDKAIKGRVKSTYIRAFIPTEAIEMLFDFPFVWQYYKPQLYNGDAITIWHKEDTRHIRQVTIYREDKFFN
jgi:hypothetical protein